MGPKSNDLDVGLLFARFLWFWSMIAFDAEGDGIASQLDCSGNFELVAIALSLLVVLNNARLETKFVSRIFLREL